MPRRPPPPAWALTDEHRERTAAAQREKFMRWACVKAGSFRGAQADQVYAALKADGGSPGPAMSELVPEVPWHRAEFVNAPEKGRDRLDVEVFFSTAADGRPELMGTRLWERMAADRDAFALFKVAGMRGSDDRLWCVFRLADAMTGEGRSRIVVPQRDLHLVAMQLDDYILSAI